jgi:uncharacterized protein (TIGR02646 family)
MKYIKKGEEPKSLTEWNQQRRNNIPNWKNIDRDVKNDLFYSLLKEQGFICCYCGSSIGRRECHIEHFQPKSVYPHLTYEYNNLIASCQGEDEKRPRVPIHCGHKKGNWYNELLIISPLDKSCVDYFKYSGSGEILPTDEKDKQTVAETTIAKLALNINKLTKMRRQAIDAILFDIENFSREEIKLLIKAYQKPDEKGYLIPFSAAITYILKQYF